MPKVTPETTDRKYDLYSQSAKDNPYPVFATMREADPVFCQPGIDGKTMIWFLSRYGDVQAMLHDDERFVRDQNIAGLTTGQFPPNPVIDAVGSHMLNKDGADHRRLRDLVSKAFTPTRVRALRPHIQAVSDELLAATAANGAMDLVADYAFPLPTIVISHLLGVPAEDRYRFREWSGAFVAPVFSAEAQAPAGRLLRDFVRASRLLREFAEYLNALFAARRAKPRDDLISALLYAEQAGDQLSPAELLSTVVLLISAGHETTLNLIGNAALALLRDPAAMVALRENPARLPAAIEEFLRYDSPVERALIRWVVKDTTLGGQLLRRGDLAIGLIGAANRDPAVFDQPDTLDLDRGSMRHLAFGHGAHYCLGAPLARLEGEIALTALLRLPGLRLAVPEAELHWRLTPMFRGLVALPVAWD